MGFLVILFVATPTQGEEADSTSTSAGEEIEITSVTIRVKHRVWDEFKEDAKVVMDEEFQIGDTDFTAVMDRFVPDFAMNLKTREIVSRSPELKNPAFRLIVMENQEPQDTTWAFLNALPHFTRNTLLSFQIIGIDIEGREPIVVPDTLNTEVEEK
jgi:hypothetical protein